VGVAVDRDVRDREGVPDEPLALSEVLVQRLERAVPGSPLPLQLVRVAVLLAEQRDPEPRDGQVRLDLVLLEEHPLEGTGALERVGRDIRRPVAEVPENRVRLGEVLPVVELERRHP
jgi:hypothetical protein